MNLVMTFTTVDLWVDSTMDTKKIVSGFTVGGNEIVKDNISRRTCVFEIKSKQIVSVTRQYRQP